MKRTKLEKPEQESFSRKVILAAYNKDAFFQINKNLIQVYGFNLAAYISVLVSKLGYYDSINKLKFGGFFFSHEKQLAECVGLSDHAIRKYKKTLIESGLLKIKKVGLPYKEYYILNTDQLAEETDLLPKLQNFKLKNSKISSSGASEFQAHNNKNNIKTKNNKEQNNVLEKIFSFQEFKDMFSSEYKNDSEFCKAIEDFYEFRRTSCTKNSKLIPFTNDAIKRLATKLQKFPVDSCLQAIDNSITCNWPGVFPENIFIKKKSNSPDSKPDISARINSVFSKCYGGDLTENFQKDVLRPLRYAYHDLSDALQSKVIDLFEYFVEKQKKIVPSRFKLPGKDLRTPAQIHSPFSLLKLYVTWIINEAHFTDIGPGSFEPNSKTFDLFVKFTKKNHVYDFQTGKQNNY